MSGLRDQRIWLVRLLNVREFVSQTVVQCQGLV